MTEEPGGKTGALRRARNGSEARKRCSPSTAATGRGSRSASASPPAGLRSAAAHPCWRSKPAAARPGCWRRREARRGDRAVPARRPAAAGWRSGASSRSVPPARSARASREEDAAGRGGRRRVARPAADRDRSGGLGRRRAHSSGGEKHDATIYYDIGARRSHRLLVRPDRAGRALHAAARLRTSLRAGPQLRLAAERLPRAPSGSGR